MIGSAIALMLWSHLGQSAGVLPKTKDRLAAKRLELFHSYSFQLPAITHLKASDPYHLPWDRSGADFIHETYWFRAGVFDRMYASAPSTGTGYQGLSYDTICCFGIKNGEARMIWSVDYRSGRLDRKYHGTGLAEIIGLDPKRIQNASIRGELSKSNAYVEYFKGDGDSPWYTTLLDEKGKSLARKIDDEHYTFRTLFAEQTYLRKTSTHSSKRNK